MGRKRPCRICRRWFHPHPRAGERQHVCSAGACQRERHRRACKQWREQEAPAERQHRLRQRIRADADCGQGPAAGLGARLAWDAVRDAVGLEVTVVIEEMLRVLEDTVRDAVRQQVSGISRESSQVVPPGRRDDIVLGNASP